MSFRNKFSDEEIRVLNVIIDELVSYSAYMDQLYNIFLPFVFSGRSSPDVQRVFRSVAVLRFKSGNVADLLRDLLRKNLPEQ